MKRVFYTSYLNRDFEVLFEKSEDGIIEGFTPNYIRVSIPGNRKYENQLLNVNLKSLDIDDVMKAEMHSLKMAMAN